MLESLLHQEKIHSSSYRSRTPSYYLKRLDPQVLASLTPEQLEAVTLVLKQAIPQASPKLVDFKFTIDLIISRFYVVLFVGKDRRKQQRQYVNEGIARVGNAIAAVVLLVAINLVVSALIVLFAYLFKSAIGIDLFPNHLAETVKQVL